MAFCINCGTELKEGFEFCPECGERAVSVLDTSHGGPTIFSDYKGQTKICQKCGEEMPADAFYCLNCGNTFSASNTNIDFGMMKKTANIQMGTWRNKWVALLLCIFLGGLGVHRFYEGKVFTGLLYLFTLGIFGCGWLFDIIRIALKPNPYRAK